ncbi:MAG TPA: hypothetical protein PKN33_13825 [Phycisphaerae bacterium]|nr:hypothetical protein [Phycisphaerae bacterium]
MPSPIEIMQSWIKGRVRHGVSGHTWLTNAQESLYHWALAVENHAHIFGTDHHTEPPTDLAVGYFCRIGYDYNDVPDPIDAQKTHTTWIGDLAQLAHGNPQALGDPNYTPKIFTPLTTLIEWISGRLAYAYNGGPNDIPKGVWSDKLDQWTTLIYEENDHDLEEVYKSQPTALALGYLAHAVVNYGDVGNPANSGDEIDMMLLGQEIALFDGRTQQLTGDCTPSRAEQCATTVRRVQENRAHRRKRQDKSQSHDDPCGQTPHQE